MRRTSWNLLLAVVVVAGCTGGTSGRTAAPAQTPSPAATEITGTLAITTPMSGSTVEWPHLTVSGTAPAGARVVQDIPMAPDQETTADDAGSWSIVVTLDEGLNTLAFRIGDDGSTKQQLTVTYKPGTAVATESPVAEPTAEPTPEATSTPEPNPFAFPVITLKGRGDKIARFKIPEDVPAIATFSERGSSNFIVYSLAADGSENDLIVNEIGNYVGTHLFDTSDGEHSVAFKISSNGSWTIKIKPITSAPKWDATAKLAGKGASVIWVTGDVGDFFVTRITHRGTSNFVVYAYADSDYELLVNEIGNYSGEQILPVGTYLLEILADGSWAVLPE